MHRAHGAAGGGHLRDLRRGEPEEGHLGQGLLEVESGGLLWQVEPAELETIRPLLGAVDSLPGEVVKSNPTRRVLRTQETAAGVLYVKSYFVRGPLETLKHLVVPSKARSEHEAMRRLRAAGVATAPPIAHGERRRFGLLEGAAFISRAIPGARPFARVLDEVRERGDATERRRLAEGVAELACAIARAGADHRDLHIGNVLLDAEGRPAIIDLHAVSFPRRLTRGRRFERLARLALSLGPVHEDRRVAEWGREELAWFSEVVARLDPEHGDARALAHALEQRARALLERHLASRDRRCVVDSKGFAVEGPRSRRVYRRREAPPVAVEAALTAPSKELLHRHSRGRSVLELVDAPGPLDTVAGSSSLVRKREEYPRLASRVGSIFTGTRARKAWLAARALDVRGIPAPRAVALVEARALGVIPVRSWLLLEHLPGMTMVHVYLMERLKKGEPRLRRELARALGRLVARLHARGLVHRDLAVQNVLLRERADGTFDLYFVDLDEVRVKKPSEREALRALVQVADLPAAASRSDKLRGFRAYLEEGGAPALHALVQRVGEREVWRRIARALEERALEKQRRAERRARRG